MHTHTHTIDSVCSPLAACATVWVRVTQTLSFSKTTAVRNASSSLRRCVRSIRSHSHVQNRAHSRRRVASSRRDCVCACVSLSGRGWLGRRTDRGDPAQPHLVGGDAARVAQLFDDRIVVRIYFAPCVDASAGRRQSLIARTLCVCLCVRCYTNIARLCIVIFNIQSYSS